RLGYTDRPPLPGAGGRCAPAGLPYSTTSPGGAVSHVSYTQAGNVDSTADADGLLTSYTYDNLGRVLTKKVVSDTYPAGLVTSYPYDGVDQVVLLTDPPVTDRVT